MPLQHARETCARRAHAAETLEIIANEILAARDLVKAGHMAVQVLDGGDEAEAISELLDTIGSRLAGIAEKAERGGRQDQPQAEASA